LVVEIFKWTARSQSAV